MVINQNFVGQLKSVGYKLTKPRVEILKILSSKNPLSAQEVFEDMKHKGVGVDLVTIYRTLELFNDLGITRKNQFEDNITRYELVDKNDHHHHLICTNCGKIEDVALNENKFVSQIERKSKFKVLRHSLEFFGLCQKCQI